MTPRHSKRVPVARSKASDYLNVAENFYNGAEVAKGFEYWNAAGLLAVHAAIAYTDALTVRHGGARSKGEDHMAAAELLRQVLTLDDRAQAAIRHLERIIHEKNRVSYEGEIYTRKDVDMVWRHLLRYRDWAARMLNP